MITKWDKFIIISVFIIAVVIYCVFSFVLFDGQAEGVEIFVDGKEYATYKFSGISDTKIVEIKTEFGYNILELTSQSAKITDASCPDKVDIQNGEITKPGQILVCVPNRLSVKITGKADNSVDKVTY